MGTKYLAPNHSDLYAHIVTKSDIYTTSSASIHLDLGLGVTMNLGQLHRPTESHRMSENREKLNYKGGHGVTIATRKHRAVENAIVERRTRSTVIARNIDSRWMGV